MPGAGGGGGAGKRRGLARSTPWSNVLIVIFVWDFIYQLEKNGQRCTNQLVNITIFPFFSKL